MQGEILDLVIIGGGPAGLTAAIYASRMSMRALLLERGLLGGRAIEAPIVENFPGFPEGIGGAELIDRMVRQAEKSGAEMRHPEEVLDLVLDGGVKVAATRYFEYESLGIIVAVGTERKKLLVPGETKFLGRGVSYCAVCDGPLFKGKVTAVVGLGDEALEDALYLSNLSRKVLVITEHEKVEAARALLGVFAAGDCTCGGMQIITAAGEGAMAAIQAYRYVRKVKK